MEEWYQSNKVSFQRNRGCMVNYRNVSYALGVLVLVEAGFFALCAGVSFYYQEEDYIHFLETLLINVVLGGLLLLGGKRNEVSINRRDGYCIDRKSTRLNSSHLVISYAVFCLKKKCLF